MPQHQTTPHHNLPGTGPPKAETSSSPPLPLIWTARSCPGKNRRKPHNWKHGRCVVETEIPSWIPNVERKIGKERKERNGFEKNDTMHCCEKKIAPCSICPIPDSSEWCVIAKIIHDLSKRSKKNGNMESQVENNCELRRGDYGT